jgi:hypothetical protein
MLAAYPVEPKMTDLTTYPLNLSEASAKRVKQLWKLVDKPEDVAEAASRSGAVFGENKQEICARIDRRLRAPVGCTYCVEGSGRYGYGPSQASFIQYPYPVLLKDSKKSGPAEAQNSHGYYYSGGVIEGDTKERLWRTAKRAARKKGGCFISDLYTYSTKPKRLDPIEKDLLAENTGLGVQLVFDADRVKRLVARRAKLEQRNAKKAKAESKKQTKKKLELDELYTAKDIMVNIAKEMFEIIWFQELAAFMCNPTRRWGNWEWQTRRLGPSIMAAHELAVALKKITRVRRKVYRKWMPSLPKKKKLLMSYGVSEEFFKFVETELARFKPKEKKCESISSASTSTGSSTDTPDGKGKDSPKSAESPSKESETE